MKSEDLSEEAIRENCPHCNIKSQAFHDFLDESDNFFIVCDSHPLEEGHILLIPRKHISCIGEYPDDIIDEFLDLYKYIAKFIKKTYGSVAIFEHGITGQTVFHSHIHFLPFEGNPANIIPEGNEYIQQIDSVIDLKKIFKKDGKYLFFSMGKSNWVVDTKITAPRFFRDRFAISLGNRERADWKKFHSNKSLMQEGYKENEECKNKWKEYKRNDPTDLIKRTLQ
ncbi:MAG: HIT family protein [bacterium]|nr:HIT family protein [bacterium]